MERDSKMADLSLFLEFQCRLIRMTFLELFKLFNILGMHQIKVKILHSAAFQLGLKSGRISSSFRRNFQSAYP